MDLAKFGAVSVRGEFEGEGALEPELSLLAKTASDAHLPLTLKLGGAEALSDLKIAQHMGASRIVAPMIETPYALTKFEEMIVHWGSGERFFANIETETAIRNFADMLKTPHIDLIAGIGFGRVDLAGSLGLDRSEVDSPRFFELARGTFRLAKAQGLKTSIGGAVTARSLSGFRSLAEEGLLDFWETRKVVFSAGALTQGEAALESANRFEIEWLEAKGDSADAARLEMLRARLK